MESAAQTTDTAVNPDRPTSRLGARPEKIAIVQWLLPLLLVAIAYRGSWNHEFMGDSAFLIRDNLFLQNWQYTWENLTRDYFWSSSGNSIPYWRPLTKLSWMLEFQFFGREPLGYHLVLLGWFGLAVTGVQALGRQLGLRGWWAAAASILFGLHAAAIEPVSSIMASSDVICTAASVWALLAGQRWLKSGDWRDGTALFLLLILALGTKEVGVLIAPLLTLWVVLQQRWFSSDKASFPSARLLPIWLLVALYLGLRGAVLGDHAVTAPDLNLQRIFTGLGEYVWGVIPFRFATDVHSLSKAEADATLTLFLAALAWIALASFGLFCCYRRATQPLYLLAWLVASCLPVLMVSDMNVPGVTGKYALSDRWLIQAAAASSILAALGLQHFSRQRLPRILGAATCVAWAGIQLVTADSTHAFYRNDLTFLQHEEQLFQDTPEQFRTEEDQCRHHNRIAITALTKHEFPKALHVYDTTPAFCEWERSRAFNQLSVLVALGEYERAEPILEELLQRSEGDRRANGSLHLLGARVMIEARDLDRAQFMLKRAATLGANNTDTTRLQELLAAKT